MYRHAYFDLWLHDDAELSQVLGSGITERVTLHEWPLSCVQRLTTTDGRRLIYKSQSGPTVEPEFYARARSAVLPAAKTIHRADSYACMIMEFVEGRLARDFALPEADAAKMGRALQQHIARITGEHPHFLDVSSPDRWSVLMRTMLAELHELVASGSLKLVDRDTVLRIEHWAFSGPILSVMAGRPGCVHGDLRGDNVFVIPGGYRVIDWQRPLLGPADLDLATWMESLGFDPLRHVAEEIVWAMYLLRIGWLTQCTVQWFPEGMPDYDRLIAHLAGQLGHHG